MSIQCSESLKALPHWPKTDAHPVLFFLNSNLCVGRIHTSISLNYTCNYNNNNNNNNNNKIK